MFAVTLITLVPRAWTMIPAAATAAHLLTSAPCSTQVTKAGARPSELIWGADSTDHRMSQFFEWFIGAVGLFGPIGPAADSGHFSVGLRS
jgi:hypothetical protein